MTVLAEPTGLQRIFDFRDYGELLPLVHNSLIAGAVLGVVGGLVSVFVMMRDLPFAVHGISELSFAGASGFLLLGSSVVAGAMTGSIAAALLIGALGTRARERNSIIGVVMPFGLGLGVLFLSLYEGRSGNKFGLLVGQITGVDTPQLVTLTATAIAVTTALVAIWRPLAFASSDPELAAARGVPVRLLSAVFMVLLALTVAVAIQVVGALLVLSIICTPAAAAMRITSAPATTLALSVTFAVVSLLGGILLELGSTIPISPYVTTISFTIYLVCRVVEQCRHRPNSSMV